VTLEGVRALIAVARDAAPGGQERLNIGLPGERRVAAVRLLCGPGVGAASRFACGHV